MIKTQAIRATSEEQNEISHHKIDNNVGIRPPAQLDSINRRRCGAFLSNEFRRQVRIR